MAGGAPLEPRRAAAASVSSRTRRGPRRRSSACTRTRHRRVRARALAAGVAGDELIFVAGLGADVRLLDPTASASVEWLLDAGLIRACSPRLRQSGAGDDEFAPAYNRERFSSPERGAMPRAAWHSSFKSTAVPRSARSSASRMSRSRLDKWSKAGHQLVVVVSAMSGETNRLIGLAKEVQANPDPRELDVIASTGEQVTIGLLAMALKEAGLKAKSYTGPQVHVLTDSAFTKARIIEIDEKKIRADLARRHDRRRRRFPGRRRVRQPHDARPWRLRHLRRRARRRAEGRRVPDLHRCRRRLHDRPAHRARGAPAREDHLRGDARDGEPRLQGAADPLGGVRRQVQGHAARAVEPDRARPAARDEAHPAR